MAAEDTFTLSSLKDHAKTKGMWAGALEPIQTNERGLTKEGLLIPITTDQTPALLKIIDEITVNASDQAKALLGSPLKVRVTEVDLIFDMSDGRVTVRNNGIGIPVVLQPELTASRGYPVYIPEVAFAEFLAGSNMKKSENNVKGGINGLGAKIANVHSDLFEIETVDNATKQTYTQRWRKRLDIREAPVIVKNKTQVPSYTQVSFIPAYAGLKYKTRQGNGVGCGLPRPEVIMDIQSWFRLRAHQIAAYLGPKIRVTFNGVVCTTTDSVLLSKLITDTYVDTDDIARISAQIKSTDPVYKPHPLSITVLVMPQGEKINRKLSDPNMTIINGVVSKSGSHITFVRKAINAAVDVKTKKITKSGPVSKTAAGIAAAAAASKVAARARTSVAVDSIHIVITGAIPNSDWSGQRKDELQLSTDILNKYNIPAAFLSDVGKLIADRLLAVRVSSTTKVVHDKYTPAKYAGTKARKAGTYLLVAEGDSALTFLKDGLGLNNAKKLTTPGPSIDWCGRISIQGVILNALREVTRSVSVSGRVTLIKSDKLRENERLNQLMNAYGLDYARSYNTPEDVATLKYGKILLCVDQDLDGTGKIAPLVLVWIHMFWPELIRNGHVGRLMTPLIRAHPKKGPSVEFFYETDFDAWLEEDPNRSSTHSVSYYKGLAAHEGVEVAKMFTPEAFSRAIYIYTEDELTHVRFEQYFGEDSAPRKELLATPVIPLPADQAVELTRTQTILMGRQQLDVDTKLYKQDATLRQIPNVIDGLNPARRKILTGAIKRFANEPASKNLKVFQLGGYVADTMMYHHGDKSLNGTIIYMAREFPGARRYPYLEGVGQFGNRHGDSAGSARYIGVKLRRLVRVAFPPVDRWHLHYVFEDGQRAEPISYVPVLPMAVLESANNVSEGWKHISFGREFNAVCDIVRAYIDGDPALHEAAARVRNDGRVTDSMLNDIAEVSAMWKLPAETSGFNVEVRPYDKHEECCFGTYQTSLDLSIIQIIDLPIGVSTSKYMEKWKVTPIVHSFIKSVDDRSSSDSINIIVTLHEGGYERAQEQYGDIDIDHIEDMLDLRKAMSPLLNYGDAGRILEYKNYLAPILYWAPVRAKMYITRIQRELTVTEIRITEEQNIIRYIGMSQKLNLASLDDDDAADSVLKANDFPRIYQTLLHAPEYTTSDELVKLVINGPKSTFGYILNLKERDLIKSSVTKREKVLAQLTATRDVYVSQLSESPVPCASVWLSEIDAFTEEM